MNVQFKTKNSPHVDEPYFSSKMELEMDFVPLTNEGHKLFLENSSWLKLSKKPKIAIITPKGK